MMYKFDNETEAETRGTFLMVDKYDLDNNLPIEKCRVYGFGWSGEDGKFQCWSAPDVGFMKYPFGRYLQETIKNSLKEAIK